MPDDVRLNADYVAPLRRVRVVHLTGNTSMGSGIQPYDLRPDQKVISANYWRGDGNHEQLDLVIEEEAADIIRDTGA